MQFRLDLRLTGLKIEMLSSRPKENTYEDNVHVTWNQQNLDSHSLFFSTPRILRSMPEFDPQWKL
ncbi:hypothetical protein SBV1_1640021 [Verrucomicrobia bacterium]|nr:hypothetical protein SBV1_1640021 [Verrucomicrobiota bacterium]